MKKPTYDKCGLPLMVKKMAGKSLDEKIRSMADFFWLADC